MNRFAPWRCTAATFAAIFCFALSNASPALAESASELDGRAAAEYNRGLDARGAGQNRAACQHFKNAEVLYHNSIVALSGYSMQTEEQREAIKKFANQQQSSLNGAKAKASEVCGRPDGSPPSSSNSADGNLKGRQDGLLGTIRLAESQYQDADRKNKAGDYAGACASARLSADNFARVSTTLKGDRELAATFTQVDQLHANAAQVAADRDRVFCRANLGSVSAQPKSAAPLTAQAVTGRFEGAYVCGQGKTALRLDLQAGANGTLAGTFDFGGSNGVPAGSFAMKGRWTPDGFALSGDHWINQPAGFTMVDIVGHSSGDGRLSGQIKVQGCSNFDVSRR